VRSSAYPDEARSEATRGVSDIGADVSVYVLPQIFGPYVLPQMHGCICAASDPTICAASDASDSTEPRCRIIRAFERTQPRCRPLVYLFGNCEVTLNPILTSLRPSICQICQGVRIPLKLGMWNSKN
jgi:hypothetical protein